MSALDALVAQVEASRLRSHEADGKTYRFRVPSLFAVQRIVTALRRGVDGGDDLGVIVGEHLREWVGITERDLLGDAVGSDQPAGYHPSLWRVIADRDPQLVFSLAHALVEAAGADHKASEDIAGN
jgi:hypothetical protein